MLTYYGTVINELEPKLEIEIMIELLRIIFFSALLMLTFSLITMLLLYMNVIYKDKNVEKHRLKKFFKKIILLSVSIIVVLFTLYFLFQKDLKRKIYQNKEEYINEIVNVCKEENFPDSIGLEYANEAYKYLYKKYGDDLLYEGFKGNLIDSIEIRLILYFVENPKLSDSIKQYIRNSVKSKEDFKKYLKRRIIKNKDEYITQMITLTRKENIEDSLGIEYAKQTFDYFYKKYGNDIFYEGLEFTLSDNIEVGLILYFIENPNLTESSKLEIKNKIKTKEDIVELLSK
ncbi:MAG: hypothetical protein A2265_03590 [Bacteroidetes bacterium RIFOXYA12_FULL_33_9]|nr:MAG: hypothetical protein A2265_03590 [Bacteroidetes bacterium RIFOXYA12_FULL_33_9]